MVELTAPDFLLWAYLKSEVYATRLSCIQELRDHLTLNHRSAHVLRSGPLFLRRAHQDFSD